MSLVGFQSFSVTRDSVVVRFQVPSPLIVDAIAVEDQFEKALPERVSGITALYSAVAKPKAAWDCIVEIPTRRGIILDEKTVKEAHRISLGVLRVAPERLSKGEGE